MANTDYWVRFYNDSSPGGAVVLTVHRPMFDSMACLMNFGPFNDLQIPVGYHDEVFLKTDSNFINIGCYNSTDKLTWRVSAPNVYDDEYKIYTDINFTHKRIDGYWNTAISTGQVAYFRHVKVNIKSVECIFGHPDSGAYDCSAAKGGVSIMGEPDTYINIHLERTFDIPK